MFLITTNTWCGSLTQPSDTLDHSCCQVLESLFDEAFKDSAFDHGLQVVQKLWKGAGVWPKVRAPQTHVYNLSPYGIFLRACSSLNYPPGSQSWVSNCPIKLFLKVLWQVQRWRSFSYTNSFHLVSYVLSFCLLSSFLLMTWMWMFTCYCTYMPPQALGNHWKVFSTLYGM